MKEKTDKKPSHTLMDRPVPPVKGAVNVPEDIVLRPDISLKQGLLSGPQAVTDPDGWL
jgi:hypothetical protein